MFKDKQMMSRSRFDNYCITFTRHGNSLVKQHSIVIATSGTRANTKVRVIFINSGYVLRKCYRAKL